MKAHGGVTVLIHTLHAGATIHGLGRRGRETARGRVRRRGGTPRGIDMAGTGTRSVAGVDQGHRLRVDEWMNENTTKRNATGNGKEIADAGRTTLGGTDLECGGGEIELDPYVFTSLVLYIHLVLSETAEN
ncbi:hypothetical protein OH77DRAFT_1207908 [Trametes cingulata]|nr:hypothetical protein OH77DRAFT_1207908 [Trametes cingulata]